ncbi:hypothetical protein [Providencia vermicola]|uniref:hypothetical protein n=1 Tax=Providencia vermicola TaxID=333965 RepID=UPI0021FCE6FB|nr:hypothetical protein NFC79_08000 [Providencia stuartii]
MDFKQGSIIDKNTAQTILNIKIESYKKRKIYYQDQLNKLEEEYGTEEWVKLRTDFENIDLNDPAVYYKMMGDNNKPIYEYLEELSPYLIKKKFLINEIENIEAIGKKTGGIDKEKMHDELLERSYEKYDGEFVKIMLADFANRVDDSIDDDEWGIYQSDPKVYYNLSLNIPQDVNSLRDAITSFQFGDFSTFIDISGEWDTTINYIDKNGSLHPIHYSGKHIFY